MKRIVILFLVFLPLCINAQQNKGIIFIDGLNWKMIQEKARVEKKYIFVDAYASWCIPCKKMDHEIYADSIVGNIVNQNFISIKVQMDTTKDDNDFAKRSHNYQSDFSRYVEAYPTLLFFSPEGELIDRETGFHTVDDLAKIIEKIIDPTEGYFFQKAAYKEGKLNGSGLYDLSLREKRNGNDNLALNIAKTYKEKYLTVGNPNEILTPKFLLFFRTFSLLFTFDDSLVKYIYFNQEQVDKQLNFQWFSQNYIKYLIRRDMFTDIIDAQGAIINSNPNWDEIQKNIERKFDKSTAKRAVIAEQIFYYTKTRDLNKKAKYEFEQIDFNGINISDDNSLGTVNDVIFNEVFSQKVSQDVLERAISYMDIVVKAKPKNYHFRDTYANLLYKAGYQQKAIKEQEKAINFAEKDKNIMSLNSYKETIIKMKKGQPTWGVPASGGN